MHRGLQIRLTSYLGPLIGSVQFEVSLLKCKSNGDAPPLLFSKSLKGVWTGE